MPIFRDDYTRFLVELLRLSVQPADTELVVHFHLRNQRLGVDEVGLMVNTKDPDIIGFWKVMDETLEA